MSKLTLLASPGLLALVLLAGCAGDPAKNADDAHDKQLEDQRKMAQSQATTQGDMKIDDANRAKQADTAVGVAPADAKMIEARRVAQAKAQERVDKADAKTRELKGKVANAGAKATTASRDSLTTVDTQRGIVQHDIDAMQNVGNDSFESAKSHLNADIDALEGLIDKANKEVSNMK